MTATALITGATGLLGRQVVKAFEAAGYDVVGTGFSRAAPPRIRKVDIQNSDEISNLFAEVKPSVVVHCAADRQPDSCTNNPEGARKLNVGATETLAKAAQDAGAFLIYISTDYVFPGRPGDAPYAASAEPSPTNVYGQTKLDGEAAVLQTSANAVVLRVPVLYGDTDPHHNNKESAVNVLMDSLHKAQKDTVKMDHYAIRYPTNTEDVGRVCADIAKLYTQSANTERPKVLQFSSEDRMTKYEIVQKFSEIMGLPLDNMQVDTESGKKPGPDGTMRPYDCHLSTVELKDLGVDISTVDFVAWWRRKVGAFRH